MTMENKQRYLEQGLANAREAARELAQCDDTTIRQVLNTLADEALAHSEAILTANLSDLSRMAETDPKYDRLLLNPARLSAIAGDLRAVASLPCPVGEVLQHTQLENGLELNKVRVPMGVIAVIFESRPNVTFDVVALCLKRLKAFVLKGSSVERETNNVVVELIHRVFVDAGLTAAIVFLAPT